MLKKTCISYMFVFSFTLFWYSCATQYESPQTLQAPPSMAESQPSVLPPTSPVSPPVNTPLKKDDPFNDLIQKAQKDLDKHQFVKALQTAQQAFEHAQSNFKMKSEERMNAHRLLAEIYQKQKKYPAAEKHYQQAYMIQKDMLGDRHKQTLNLLDQMGLFYCQWGKTQKAAQAYQTLNQLYQEMFGNNHRKTLSVVDRLAKLFLDSQQYTNARPYAAQALKICTEIYGNTSLYTIDAMIQAGKTYYYCKSYIRAFNTFDHVLSIIQEKDTIQSSKKLEVYEFLADLHQLQKRYQDAEDMYKKAIALSQQMQGPENNIQFMMNQKLTELYKIQDRYQEAKTSLVQTVQLAGAIWGDKHPKTIALQEDLAELLFKQKEYGRAAEILSQALESSKTLFGDHHEKTFALSKRLAEIFIAQARYQEAESLYRNNLAVQKKILTATRENLKQLAQLFKMQKNCSGAIPLMDQAFRLNEATLGPTDPETLQSLMELIGCMVKNNQHEQAVETLKRIEKPLYKQQFELSRSHQNLTQRPATAVTLTNKQDVELNTQTFCHAVLSLTRSMSNQEAISYAADVMLRWQYLTTFPEPGRVGLPGHQDINTLFQIQMALLPYRLPRNSAFFHILPYDHIDFSNAQKTETRWFAMMILSEENTDNMFCQDLGPIQVTKKLTKQLMSESDPKQMFDIESRLYQHFFGIFEETIKDIQSIYISASGYAHLIPYSRLRLKDGRFWIERQQICRVFSAMDFLKQVSPVYTGSLLAIGQINYDDFLETDTGTLNEKALHSSEKINNIPLPQTQQVNFKYRAHPDETRVIEEIINIYDVSRKTSPVFWSTTEANESAIKKMAYPPRVLHFCADCFYLNPKTDPAVNISGALVLAGANKGLMKQTGPSGQDGLLLDAEILDLNLKGTELVYLAKKCDGYQDGTAFSPFFQMAAAFHMAGCRFVLSPVWAVKHEMASPFIIRFYENWLRQSISNPSKALRKTKLQHIAENSPPNIWASYVLMGF
ncbi:MAG: CHAT domain-containing protein [Candidatus Magnetomorum sp.]|nr:CHAT domain-containing protein [Candidatus Magnetomorum sp.]